MSARVRRKVTVELTYAEAMALFSLADCAMGIPDYDGLGVLDNMSSVNAGVRAIEKLFVAAHGVNREAARVHMPEPTPNCPHGCGPLRWVEDQWYCPKCGDEWGREVES